MPDAARDTTSTRRRRVAALACVVAAVCLAIVFWPVSQAAVPFAPRAEHRDTAGPVRATAAASEGPAPERAAVAAVHTTHGSGADDGDASLRIVFDPFEALVARRAIASVHFGAADGPVRQAMVFAPISVNVRAASHDWLIHDGHLRRVRGSGAMLRIPIGEHVQTMPGSSGNDWPDLPSQPSPLAKASLRERMDSTEAGLFGFMPNQRDDAPRFRLSGVVRTPSGADAKERVITITDIATEMAVSPAMSDDGAFQASNLRAGTYRVRAASRLGGRAEQIVHVTADTAIELVLQRRLDVRGRVVDHDGEGVASARMLWAAPGEYRNQVVTDRSGSFVLADLDGAVGTLWACVPGDAPQLPAVGRAVGPGEAVELVLDRRACRGSVRVRVEFPDGVRAHEVSVRLWQQHSELGVLLGRLRTDGPTVELRRDHVPRGHYRLEVYCPRFGAIDAGTHWLDGTSEQAFDVALPAPALVTFALPDARLAASNDFELVRVGAAVDLLIATDQPFAGPHLLGPGRYAVWWRGETRVRSHELTVATAGPQTVDLRD